LSVGLMHARMGTKLLHDHQTPYIKNVQAIFM
jgi:hypothetical protein